MKRWTDEMRTGIRRGSYTDWLDQSLAQVKTKVKAAQPSQPTPSQINRQDTVQIEARSGRKWNEVTLEKPSAPASQPIPTHAQRLTRRDDGATRDHFAQTHPEYTGGLEGARTRAANTAVTQLRLMLNKDIKDYQAGLRDNSVRADTELIGVGGARSTGAWRAKEARTQLATLDALEEQQAIARRLAEYESLRDAADFEEKSKYDMGAGSVHVGDGILSQWRYKYPTYAALNGDERARDEMRQGFQFTYEDIPEDVVRMYNYLFKTQGESEAKKYLDLAASPNYTTWGSALMGMYHGSGAQGVVDILSGGAAAKDQAKWATEARRSHPTAYGVGEVGGSVASLLGAGAVGKTIGVTSPAANSALAFGGTQAVRGASDVFTGNVTPGDYALSVLGSAAGGAVGSVAAQGVTSLGGTALDKASKALGQEWLRHNVFTNAVNQGLGGAAFSIGNAVTRGIVDPNYNPSPEELTKDAAVSFAFQTITSAVRLAGRTDQAKAALEQDVAVLKRDFETIAKAEMAGEITPTDTIELMKIRSATLRVTIEGTRYIGQGKMVDDALAYLDQLDDFLAEAAKHNAATMLGSGEGGLGLDSRQTATASGMPQGDAQTIGQKGMESVAGQDKPLFTKTEGHDNIIAGALNPESGRAESHAELYYEEIRHMTTDVAKIAKVTGHSEAEIQAVKEFLFLDEHDLFGGRQRFYPDFSIAESWQRLINGTPEPHDLTLLLHEIMERELMLQGYTQAEAHEMTSKVYNYKEEAKRFYDHTKKHQENETNH